MSVSKDDERKLACLELAVKNLPGGSPDSIVDAARTFYGFLTTRMGQIIGPDHLEAGDS